MLDRRADALERDVGVALARVREQQRELVAPEPERAVAGARIAQQLGELAQQAVAVLVAVAVVLELEVVDVEQRERDRRAVAQRLPDRTGELVLEGTMVVEVGQPVTARALQGGAVEHADAPAAEQVEERQRDQQAQHHEQPEAVAERCDARLQRLAGAVLGEHDVAVEQLERDDVGVGRAVAGQDAGDRPLRAGDLADQRIAARRADLAGGRRGEHGAVLLDHDNVDRVRALLDRGHQMRHLAERRLVLVALHLGGAALERARVRGVHGGLLADQVLLDAAADDEVLEGAHGAQREHEGEEQSGDDALAQAESARVETGRAHPRLHRQTGMRT